MLCRCCFEEGYLFIIEGIIDQIVRKGDCLERAPEKDVSTVRISIHECFEKKLRKSDLSIS